MAAVRRAARRADDQRVGEAVESRTTISTPGDSTRGLRPAINARIASADRSPSRRTDWRTQVSGGTVYEEDGRSSNPTTEMSAGTESR